MHALSRETAIELFERRRQAWLSGDTDAYLDLWTDDMVIEGEVRDAGRRVRWRGMSICRIREGLICEWREYWDPARLEP